MSLTLLGKSSGYGCAGQWLHCQKGLLSSILILMKRSPPGTNSSGINGVRRSSSPAPTSSAGYPPSAPALGGTTVAPDVEPGKRPEPTTTGSEAGDSSRTGTPPASTPAPTHPDSASGLGSLGAQSASGTRQSSAMGGPVRTLLQPGRGQLESEGSGLRHMGSGLDPGWRPRSPEGSVNVEDTPSAASVAARLGPMRPSIPGSPGFGALVCTSLQTCSGQTCNGGSRLKVCLKVYNRFDICKRRQSIVCSNGAACTGCRPAC